MFERRIAQRIALAALVLVLTGWGCSAGRKVSNAFRVTPGQANLSRKVPQASPSKPAVRAALRTQSQGAFDPLRDDPRLKSLQAAVRLNSLNPLGRLQLAQRYEEYGLFDQAMDEYLRLLKDAVAGAASSEPPSLPTMHASLKGVARAGLRSERAGEAVSALEGVMPQDADAELHMRMGLLYARIGDSGKAESSFRSAVQKDPHSAAAHNNLGYQIMKRGLLVEAETQFREAIGTGAGSLAARNNLGLLLTQRGDLQGAWEQFAATGDQALSRNNFAVALLAAGRLLEGREQLTLALRARRGFAPALHNFQLVQARIKAAQAGLSKSPDDALSRQDLSEKNEGADAAALANAN